MFKKFRDAGFCVIPEKAGIPLVKWSQYMSELPGDECSEWHDDYGLVTGKVSNIVAIDIDTDDPAIIAQVEAFAGISPLKKRGSKGFTSFYKYSGEKSSVWKKDNKVVVELLSDKRKTTIPPSIHRITNMPYTWTNEFDLFSADLSLLPQNFIQAMNLLFPISSKEQINFKNYDSPFLDQEIDFNEAIIMLSYISADLPYFEWLSIGMALKDEFGDAGFPLWNDWSSSAPSKYKSYEMWIKWRSFGNSGYTIGTLVYFAQNGGWFAKPIVVDIDNTEIDLSYLNKKKLEERKIFHAHGLVGEIADWITATAIRPQPMLALGAALAFVGMLKGHKFSTSTGLRTNFLAMNIAPTASGKEHPQWCIDNLIDNCLLGKHSLSEPTSGTALLKGLLDADRVGLWSIDELGRYLGHLNNKNSGGYQREIIDYTMKSFSKANGKLSGKKYANEKHNPRIDVLEPHLCVIGASVKEKIVENCTSSDAIDGFLNRWILFESNLRPKRNKEINFNRDIPPHIAEAVKIIIATDPNSITANSYGLAIDQRPIIKIVKYTSEALAIISEYIELVEELTDKAAYPLSALYGRSAEHVSKIALILCDNEFIRPKDVELAIEIVSESNKLIAAFTGLIADNEHQKMHIRVLSLIQKYGTISNTRFIRLTNYCNSKLRKEIVSDLITSGQVELIEKGKTFDLQFLER